jgi:hypothetical protein
MKSLMMRARDGQEKTVDGADIAALEATLRDGLDKPEVRVDHRQPPFRQPGHGGG